MKVQKNKNKLQNNIIKLFFGVIIAILVLIGRYGWVQLVEGDQMMARLKGQVQEESVLHVPRGTIYDANMKEMAISTMVSSLFVDPNHTENPEQVATDLAPIIGMTKEEILERIGRGGGFVWLKRQMEPEMTNAVKNLMKQKPEYNACLGFRQESKRYYPNDMLAANVLVLSVLMIRGLMVLSNSLIA